MGRLYEIGGGAGANRLGLSVDEQEAFELARNWMEEAGLVTEWLPGGSLVGRLVATDGAASEVWFGSHLDSVPNGGRFDGALGVVASIEAADELRQAVSARARTISVVAFRDEEGVRFGGGYFGSRALFGGLSPNDLQRTDSNGITVEIALTRLGLDVPSPQGWDGAVPEMFIEPHIEQGPQLASVDAPLGVVTDVVGLVMGSIDFAGRSGHAGTVPMEVRADAFLAACKFAVQAIHEAKRSGALLTIGEVRIESAGSNIIPGAVRISTDLRSSNSSVLGQMRARLQQLAASCARECGCDATADLVVTHEPVDMAPPVQAVLRSAVERVTGDAPTLSSGAGHDAAVIGAAGVPTGMLFVRSAANGVSHTPQEHTHAADVSACVAALRYAMIELVEPEAPDGP